MTQAIDDLPQLERLSSYLLPPFSLTADLTQGLAPFLGGGSY
jgi:hypothetical protein